MREPKPEKCSRSEAQSPLAWFVPTAPLVLTMCASCVHPDPPDSKSARIEKEKKSRQAGQAWACGSKSGWCVGKCMRAQTQCTKSEFRLRTRDSSAAAACFACMDE